MAAQMLPKDRRWATYALYAFCRYADNLVDHPRDRTQRELECEIQSLIDELCTAYRSGESQHPIVQPFVYIAKKHDIPIEYPLDLIKGIEMDVQQTRYETFEDLHLFCYRVAGVVGLMMTHVLGYGSKAAFKYAEKLGIAMQLTNILRDVQEDKEMGRIYLPIEEMKKFGVSEGDILAENMTANLERLMQFQVARADRYYEEAHEGISLLKPGSQFAIYAASRIYRGILRKIEAQNCNPFLGRVFVPRKNKIGILIQEFIRTWIRIASDSTRMPKDAQFESREHEPVKKLTHDF